MLSRRPLSSQRSLTQIPGEDKHIKVSYTKSTKVNLQAHVSVLGDVLYSSSVNSGCISSVLMRRKIHLERTQGRRADRFYLHWEGFLVSVQFSERDTGTGSDVCFGLWKSKGRGLTNISSLAFGVKSTRFKSPTDTLYQLPKGQFPLRSSFLPMI